MTRATQRAADLAANTALVHRQHDLLNGDDLEGAVALFAEGTRNHGQPVGRAGVHLC